MEEVSYWEEIGKLLGPGAALITVLACFISGIILFRKILKELKHGIYTHDPNKTVVSNMHLLRSVQGGIETLINQLPEDDFDYVVGIGAGGAIVGGMVARNLRIPFVSMRETEPNSDDYVVSDDIINGKHILVVDDAVRTGRTLDDATKALREKYNPESIRIATLLKNTTRRSARNHAPGDLVDFHGLATTDTDIALPWDYSRHERSKHLR